MTRCFTLLLLLSGWFVAQSPQPGIGSWTQFRGDPAARAVSHSPRPAYKGVKWKHNLGGPSTSTPAVADGRVVVPTEAGWLYAVDVKDGKRIWQRKLDCQAVIASSPMIVKGVVIVGAKGGDIIATKLADGAPAWTVKTGADAVYASPRGDENGVVIGDMKGVVWCLEPETGKVLWQRKLAREVAASAVFVGDHVFVATRGKILAELDRKNGEVLRELPLPFVTASTPAIGMGYLYTMCGADQGLAIDLLDGRKVWSHDNALDDQSSVAFADGTVYMPMGQHLKAIHGRTGEVLWTCKTNHKIGPVLVNGDDVLCACRDRVFRVVDRKTGKVSFELAFEEGFVSGPVLVDGTVYLAADMDMGMHLYAIE